MAEKKTLPKITRKEMRAPDKFQDLMNSSYDFFKMYFGWFIAGIAVVLVGILGGVILSRYNASRCDGKSLAFYKAYAPVFSAVLTVPSAGDEETAKAAIDTKALGTSVTAISEFVESAKGNDIRFVAELGRAAAALLAGDSETAMTAYKAFLDNSPESSLASIAWEGFGYAAWKAGKIDDATRAFTQQTNAKTSLVRALGFLHLGDTVSPAFASEGSDPAKAREFYQNGIKELGGEPSLMVSENLLIRRTIEERLAGLN